MTALGLSIGAGSAIFTVSLVQAEDDSGIRSVQRFDADARQRRAVPQQAAYASTQGLAYAPARNLWRLPLFQAAPDGRIAQPIALNPFQPVRTQAQGPKKVVKRALGVTLDTASGAADVARTICVRLCDGFHAPIGYLTTKSDMQPHQALCEAMNPGIPVKVFRVAAGAATIDDARAADGKRYGDLPVAFGHEMQNDAACRPAIVKAGERRISLLRDFTLRPGDSVVLDGKVRTFTGGTRWPYSTADFRDFRSAGELSKSQRKDIDDRVGISRQEAQLQGLRRQMRLREASLHDDSVASDALPLRGSLEPAMRGPVRIIAISR